MNKHFKCAVGTLFCSALMVGCSDDDEITEPILNNDVPPVAFAFPAPAEENPIPEHDFAMGALFSFQKDLRNGTLSKSGGSSSTTYWNVPLFNADASAFGATDEEWWDNLVEEMVYSGLDYVAPNCRGRLPKADTEAKYDRDHGDPTRIKDFIAALKRRNADDLKVVIFDDVPASWASARNFDLYGAYIPRFTAAQQAQYGVTDEQALYPLDNLDDIYKYIWDYNIKRAFDNFYGENQANNKYLFRFRNKPVLFLWSVNGFLNVDYAVLGGKKIDCTGKLRTILQKLHTDFKNAYGEELFICADRSFKDRDSTVDESVVESLNDWFVASEQTENRYSWSVRSFSDVSVGMAVPAFCVGDITAPRMLFDSENGKRLSNAFDDMIEKKTDLVFLEGFTDMVENAAYWRSTDTKYYDFPNQRLNILRKYNSTRAFPKSLRVEAEACDNYFDTTMHNEGGTYREGKLDVTRIDGTESRATEWYVTHTEGGEWLEWKELPYPKGQIKITLCYSARKDARIFLEFGTGTFRRQSPVIDLPATNGEWSVMEIFTAQCEVSGWRRTLLTILSGEPDLNYFTIDVE